MKNILIAFLTVFLAEMGDKTQLLALAFASKYRIKPVLVGVFFGSLLNHAIAIVFASVVSKYSAIGRLRLAAALMFIVFGLFSLKLDYEEIDEDNTEDEPKTSSLGAIMTVATAFFLGELGDKTQLTTMTVALTSSYPCLILVGSTLAMIAVSLIGILAGKMLGKKIPENTMRLFAACIFLLFGFVGLYRNMPAKYFNPPIIISFLLLFFTTILFTVRRNLKERERIRLNNDKTE